MAAKKKPERMKTTITPRIEIYERLLVLCEMRGDCSANYLIERLIDEEWERKQKKTVSNDGGNNKNNETERMAQAVNEN